MEPPHPWRRSLRDAEHPREARLDDVDRLELGARKAFGVPPQEPGLDLEVVAVDPPARDEPHHEPECDRDPDDADLGQRAARYVTEDERRQEQDRDRDRPATAANERGQRMQSPPAVVFGHNPAALASPRAASRSRSRAASSGWSPGMRASLAAAAVWSFTVASPNDRS